MSCQKYLHGSLCLPHTNIFKQNRVTSNEFSMCYIWKFAKNRYVFFPKRLIIVFFDDDLVPDFVIKLRALDMVEKDRTCGAYRLFDLEDDIFCRFVCMH